MCTEIFQPKIFPAFLVGISLEICGGDFVWRQRQTFLWESINLWVLCMSLWGRESNWIDLSLGCTILGANKESQRDLKAVN